MTFIMSTINRLSGFLLPEALGLKVVESRSLVGVIVLIAAFCLKHFPYLLRLANTWFVDARDANSLPNSQHSVTKKVVVPPVPAAKYSTSSCAEDLKSKEIDPYLAMYEKAKTPPATPPLQSSGLWLLDDCPDMSDEAWGFGVQGNLDDLWSPAGTFLARPEAAVTSDANSVLETALASGDAKLADAALAAGVRVCSSAWLTKACSQLQAAGIPLVPERCLEIIRLYGQERRADLAVDLWEAHCVELGWDPSEVDESESIPAAELYGAALEACARAGDFETASRAASSTGWRVPECRHGQAAFLALARWYARRQDVCQANECYQAVRDLTGCADLATHRAILYASVRSADMVKADELFEDLVNSGVTPDGASFSAMICGHCSSGNVEKAMEYFRLLRDRGIVPTAPLFDAILDGCASMNMPALMEQVLADMESTGIRPSTTTLSILMRIHGMNRDVEQALAIFEELPKKHGLKLDGHAYGTLISVCLKNDAYDMAWSAFERMSEAGCMAHARIYEALVSACLRQGDLDSAVDVVYKALGISNEESAEASVVLRLRLQQKTIEEVLSLVGRRRHAARLGVPMIEKLLASGVEVSESLVDAVYRCAKTEDDPPCSELHRRRSQRHSWRNFGDLVAV